MGCIKRLVVSGTAIDDVFRDFTATPGDRQVTLSWESARRSGSWTHFLIQRSQDGGVSYTDLATVPYEPTPQAECDPCTFEYVDATATNDINYYYRLFIGEWIGTSFGIDDSRGPVRSRPNGGDPVPVPSGPVIFIDKVDVGSFVLYIDSGANYANHYRIEYGPLDQSFPWSTRMEGTNRKTVSDDRLTEGRRYKVRLVGFNGAGRGTESNVEQFSLGEVAAIAGPAERTVPENYAAVLGVYTVSGTANWSLSGDDAAAFELAAASSQASLSFSPPPNYEAPTDTNEDGKNTYHVTLEATPVFGASSDEGTLADFMAAFQKSSDEDAPTWTKAVMVRVEDGDDPGVVELPSRTPRAGVSLRATFEEEDEITPGTTAWTWASAARANEPFSPIEGATGPRYTPTGDDVGRRLQATVRYVDTFGSKEVTSQATAAVRPVGVVELTPGAPQVGQQVTARLSGPDGAVTGAEWTWERQRQGSDEWHFIGSSTSAAASAAAPASKAAPSDFAAMFNSFNWGSGKVSHYEPKVQDTNWVLRATVQWGGHEVSSPDSAPVRAGVPDPPRRLEGEGYAAKVVLSWRTPNNNGSEITGYEYRKRLDDNAPWDPDWTPIDGSTKETTSHPVEDLAYDEMHTFEVRAVNAEGEGAAARTQATAGCPTPVIDGPAMLCQCQGKPRRPTGPLHRRRHPLRSAALVACRPGCASFFALPTQADRAARDSTTSSPKTPTWTTTTNCTWSPTTSTTRRSRISSTCGWRSPTSTSRWYYMAPAMWRSRKTGPAR